MDVRSDFSGEQGSGFGESEKEDASTEERRTDDVGDVCFFFNTFIIF